MRFTSSRFAVWVVILHRVANSNCLCALSLFRSRNWNITFPHRTWTNHYRMTRGFGIKIPIRLFCSFRNPMLAACAPNCERMATIILINIAVVFPHRMYEPPKNRKYGLCCAVEHTIADWANCIGFEIRGRRMNPSDWRIWEYFSRL